jgi:hypothetical protein
MCCICEAFPYADVFTSERLLRMRSVSIRRGIYIWKTAMYAKRFHMRTHLHLKDGHVCEAFPYVDTFTLEKLPRMRSVSICGGIYIWKTVAYAMRFHTRTHLHLKSYRVCEAFPYAEVFTFEMQHMRCVSIHGHIYTWKTATYAMFFHTQIMPCFSIQYSLYLPHFHFHILYTIRIQAIYLANVIYIFLDKTSHHINFHIQHPMRWPVITHNQFHHNPTSRSHRS